MCKTLELTKNIAHNEFESLLDLCFDLSTYFTFTKNRAYQPSRDTFQQLFLEEMNSFHVTTLFLPHWFCMYVIPDDEIEIDVFKINNKAKIVIKNHFDNLFLKEGTRNRTLGNIDNLPEDLCFFMENKLLLGTVSHESICYLYPPSKQIKNEFQKLGQWKEIGYLQEEHISIVV